MSRQSRTRVGFGVSRSQTVSKSASVQRVSSGKPKPSKNGTATSRHTRFSIPALSVPPKTPPIDPLLERLKRKTIRRNAPTGEDLKRIKEIIRGMYNEVVNVQEFVGLLSPYTGDQGNILGSVMGDELSSFRKMAKRVYDTMTQDVSDVLANEQIHLTDYYNERYTMFMDKMMRMISEIYQYVPNFDFERYYEDPDDYLGKLYPFSVAVEGDDEEEEEEMQRRQATYHRLQWLHLERTRLREENEKLQFRLKQLKRQQQEEMLNARKEEEIAEIRKTHLEATQADLHNTLEDLHDSVEKSFIEQVEQHRLTEDNQNMQMDPRRHIQEVRSKSVIHKPPPGEPWNVRTAKEIEGHSFAKSTTSAISSVSLVSTPSKTGYKKKAIKSRTQMKKYRQTEQETSPFHYSPPKSPPSPHRSTARGGPSPSPSPGPRTTRVESTTTVTERAPQSSHHHGRRNLAATDTWRGFM